MTRARVLAGLILLGILAGMLLRPDAAGTVVHTVALGHRVVVDVVMDAPTGITVTNALAQLFSSLCPLVL